LNIAVTISDSVLYIAAGESSGGKASFYKADIKLVHPVSKEKSGYIWDQVEDKKLLDDLKAADKVVFAMPAKISFCKKVFLDSGLNRDHKDYQEWFARKQLPGDISRYIYGFIPVGNESNGGNIEAIFYATITDRFWPLYYAVAGDDFLDKISLVPELAGLWRILVLSVDWDLTRQASIVNFHDEGAAVVFSRNAEFSVARYFPLPKSGIEELSAELEAFFLGQIDPEMPACIFMAGRENLKTLRLDLDITMKFSFMSAGFVAALGTLGFLSAGGKCELPAGI
jgi:hypothetical protein